MGIIGPLATDNVKKLKIKRHFPPKNPFSPKKEFDKKVAHKAYCHINRLRVDQANGRWAKILMYTALFMVNSVNHRSKLREAVEDIK